MPSSPPWSAGDFMRPHAQSLIPTPQSLLRAAGDALLSALLAPGCAACDAILDRPLDGCVCKNCWDHIRSITPPVCDACGDPVARPIQLCASCSSRPHAVDRSRAIGEYEGALRAIVHALKYGRRRSVARALAVQMRARGGDLLEHADWVVPVPLHWRREMHRGFNQARELARALDRPLLDALVRSRHTQAQVELAADRRQANVRGAFRLRRAWRLRRSRIAGSTVLLVDDVSTTGATLEACAAVLKEAGASRVYALTAARVVSR
jgi:ComF family protein